MTTRQIVSYDDITLPYDSSEGHQGSSGRPHPKKRRKINQQAKQVNLAPRRPTVNLDHEESRELTHEEIWDDSALVEAWEAAQQEYEIYHGTCKNWKDESVKKSPLWHNVFVDQTDKRTNGGPTAQQFNEVNQPDTEAVEPDSHPLNFDTFVPTHDPSLHIPAVNPNYVHSTGPFVNQDEAFSLAMTAMYWGGYWTAMYHCQRHFSNPNAQGAGENESDEAEEDETEEES